MSVSVILEEKWPVLGRHERAVEWLRIWADLGRAPRTIDAYARGLAEFLLVCEREGIDPVAVNRSQIALFVRELRTRPSQRGPNVVALDSGSGLANATLQQRLVAVRLFYDFLVEEGVRESNPVGRGRYTPGRHFGGSPRPLVARMVKLPWIPGEAEWLRLLEAFRLEPIRNRLMLITARTSGSSAPARTRPRSSCRTARIPAGPTGCGRPGTGRICAVAAPRRSWPGSRCPPRPRCGPS